jgi:hypothetical protein
MYINRHNKAVKLIYRAILKGPMGGLEAFMDAGDQEDMPRQVPTRLPIWLKPNSLTADQWRKFRPDILLTDPRKTKHKHIYIIELGYCSDTNHDIKFTQKSHQHAALTQHLLRQGHSVTHITFTLGTTGTIPIIAHNNLLSLGIDKQSSIKLLTKLHMHSTATATSILTMRRIKENLPPGG